VSSSYYVKYAARRNDEPEPHFSSPACRFLLFGPAAAAAPAGILLAVGKLSLRAMEASSARWKVLPGDGNFFRALEASSARWEAPSQR
jgi:hypothetical protein